MGEFGIQYISGGGPNHESIITLLAYGCEVDPYVWKYIQKIRLWNMSEAKKFATETKQVLRYIDSIYMFLSQEKLNQILAREVINMLCYEDALYDLLLAL